MHAVKAKAGTAAEAGATAKKADAAASPVVGRVAAAKAKLKLKRILVDLADRALKARPAKAEAIVAQVDAGAVDRVVPDAGRAPTPQAR